MTHARILIHPRCVEGPASGALAAYLQGQGYDTVKVVIGPPNARGRCELVRILEEGPEGMRLERFDKTEYFHKVGNPAPRPEAA
ncbi:MAG: hypothetical protein NUV51_11005 [Sulfuricaulis sp.]|nr:hypothetical protein [Sulfuricaulis sp.]